MDAYSIVKSNKNVYLDISYFGNIAAGTSLFQDFCMLINNIDQKIIFGTDFPDVNVREYISIWMYSLRLLPQEKRDNIFYNNGCKVFNL
jgi:predicted TIM-barrel fold metal-dependent hydrolase